MSFLHTGTPNPTKVAENNLAGTSNLALNTSYPAAMNQLFPQALGMLPTVMQPGGALVSGGRSTMQPGLNLFNTLLSGNRANTAAALAPSINPILQGYQAAQRAAAGLTPRGGGRFGEEYRLSFAPQADISSLFNQARWGAAQAVPGFGLQQIGAGTNLFDIAPRALQAGVGALGAGTGALGAGTQANQILGNLGLGAQAQTAQLNQMVGQGIASLLGGLFG